MNAHRTITRRRRLLPALLLVGLIHVPASSPAKESKLEPTVKADAGLVIVPAHQPPLAVDGTDASGRPLFAPANGATLLLTVDVRAQKGNRNGFGVGEFVPYLSISYSVRRADGGDAERGQLHPLVTREGLRYGNNIRLPAAGTYVFTLTVEPPIKVGFGRHTDLETGVSRWWNPLQAEWTFKHAAQSAAR